MFEPFFYFVDGGFEYSVINCPACDHRTAPGVYCGGCQTDPTRARCYGCWRRGGVPTTTVTVSVAGVNESPVPPDHTTITSTVHTTNDQPGSADQLGVA